MSSSTSSSSTLCAPSAATAPRAAGSSARFRRSHLLSILVVILVQLGAEVFVRTAGHRLHADRNVLHSFPTKARELSAASGVRAAFVGNSLALGGYGDFRSFLRSARDAGHGDYRCQMMGLYGSTLAEWYYIFKHSFVDTGRPLDVLVVNLSPGAGEDPGQSYPRIGWLPEEGGLRNFPEIALRALPRFEQRAEYATATLLSPFAYRAELRFKIHAPIIRYYLEGWQRMNDAMKLQARPEPPARPAPAPTYTMIRRLMQLGRNHGTCVVIVAMPIMDHYELDPNLIDVVRREGMPLVDARRIDGITPDKFADGWHLSRAGAEIFAAYMGRALPRAVSEYRRGFAQPGSH